MSTRKSHRRWLAGTFAISMVFALAPVAQAHPDGADDGGHDEHDHIGGNETADYLSDHDATMSNVISSGPGATVTKNLTVAGRGERLGLDATTDVWAHDGYAYTGTFNSPCGTPDAGVWVWDVSNPTRPTKVGVIASEVGDRTNDVKVASMNSGDILVMSNEPCGPGGDGGFEIYGVDDPTAPVLLASVITDDVNTFLRDALGFVEFGVHNLWLFTQGEKDYVAATVESEFGNFQIFDITDPTDPELVGWWGAEQLRLAELGSSANAADLGAGEFGLILDLDAYLFDGFGASSNRFLHDITITADGMHAYLSNWDAGLVLLDISDPTDPELVSVAIDPVNGSLDGEVNSHSAWPSEDGSIVVEGEEDFSAWEGLIPPGNLTLQDLNTIPGVAVSTTTGDVFEEAANQTSNAGSVTATAVTVTSGPLSGEVYPAVEFTGNNVPLGAGSVDGDLVWVGRACDGDAFENALSPGDIAIVRRGACFFSDKAANVAAAGAAAMVLANNQASTPWSGLRIWDYSDPEAPVLASLFDTTCSAASAPGGGCDPAGTYSSHNVVVETRGNKVLAYVSWYWDGVVVVDVTDPYHPVEVARYSDQSSAFRDQNGGPQDVWGIYKEPNSPWIYASDRNGGLYVLKEYGSGSAKKGKP